MRRATLAVFISVTPVKIEPGILVAATSCSKRFVPVIGARGLAASVLVTVIAVAALTSTPRTAIEVFVPNDMPIRRGEYVVSGSQKLLQCPPSLEPFTRRKRARIPRTIVFEVDIAFRALFVPPVHGIDSLRELGTTALVDAAGVDPRVTKSSLLSDTAEVYDLLVPGKMLDGVAALAVFLLGDLPRAPSVREDCVRVVWKIWKLPEVQRLGVEDTHCMPFMRRRNDVDVTAGEIWPHSSGADS